MLMKKIEETITTLTEILNNLKKIVDSLEKEQTEWITQEIPAKTIEWGKSSDKEMTWEESKKWCEAQGGRMPTIQELLEAYHGKVEGFVSTNYWSSSEFLASYAYYLYFGNGNVYFNLKSNSYYVRCVRDK